MSDKNKSVERSAANVWALKIIGVLAVLVLLAIAFFLGRTTAPGANTPAASPSSPQKTTAGGATAGDAQKAVADFVAQTGLVPGQDFASSVTNEGGLKAMKILRDGADEPERTLGKPDAPVTLTVLSDFSCPMCTSWGNDTLPKLQKYVDDGTLKIQWHNMVIFADQYQSDIAAKASIAAMKQGKLWDFVRAAYHTAPEGEHPTYDENKVIQIAQSIGITDLGRFKTDMNSPEAQATVSEETDSGHSVGVNGTPFFVLGDSTISGAYPIEYFEHSIEYQKFLANK
ncbi:DsbA family protein [Mobiluncus curtisii]|uniref:Thioredoxin domain-containing protein n=1 Tax=Mobiluncus curtisii TaxID=2051 RepID=A0A7Y0UH91_9ACTO|nr:thioredoxin domain-containing protein [Mobiluncus curtisii]MCU9986567.1 thioredoxin domain-containing protein [Mobiluncus curtisii]MCV0000282.1 thioredoxin domain-containing protein [Mobiluncus curtisii]NMW43622.1 thioredoxin domain-containing protein [Mobiluncus curtisii]NMW48853.1 thioredoxin domain-containing protein [Mobiluncus curtisii]NMW82431.1 thioredoxin domain-containing protein [Mobiluncus curtisii]